MESQLAGLKGSAANVLVPDTMGHNMYNIFFEQCFDHVANLGTLEIKYEI